ncbi:hypothetical protein NBRC111894_2858 [Sporolactobacillus inulinus]|uniref:Uncharacterized protein n=1 Tax=Sporolactobacillus inulinus TaxID=2078 RepID=A0A4Y1ZEC0_9BACL|nr:hypothetical protein NBRC111894_2858 [Sporolactobacillus inulinus]
MPSLSIDTIIVNSRPIKVDLLKRYAAEDSEPVQIDWRELNDLGINIIHAPLIKTVGGVVRHDEAMVGRMLMSLTMEKKV